MIPALLALLLQSAAVPAVCTQIAPPPIGLQAWNTASTAATDLVGIGKPAALTLRPADTVALAVPLARPTKGGTFGGVYHLSVSSAGTYRVALSAAAWIDLVRDGKSLRSVAHVEGAACSGVRKVVDFALDPGTYAIQLSGAAQPGMLMLIVAK